MDSVRYIAKNIVSLLGIILAGYITAGELPQLFHNGLNAYVLSLLTCAYGPIVYVAIFAAAVKGKFSA